MNHRDHVELLRAGVPAPGGVWADLGSGGGAFTLALAELLGPGAEIHAVDRDAGALRRCAATLAAHFPNARLVTRAADFADDLSLPSLDGAVMANALHFVHDKAAVLVLVRRWLKPGAPFILVEYGTDRGNSWVPYPLSYRTWEALARGCGFADVRPLHRVPSSFLGEIYSSSAR